MIRNTAEGLVAVIAGAFAGSISLVGFGIDSFSEVTSGVALLWRMSVDRDVERRERNERRALKIVGTCFLALGIFITYEAAMDLWSKKAPEHSIPGVVLACVSSRETLDQTMFDLKCSFTDCDWIGQRSGSQAQQYLSATGDSARNPDITIPRVFLSRSRILGIRGFNLLLAAGRSSLSTPCFRWSELAFWTQRIAVQ